MSRCFPFPPPGYEKKARSDNIDLLSKEKHKEKKHKKEKRDREKRESKERKDKDRTKDKHKEKKDRKEKHKEKRKEKDRDKDRRRSSEDGRTELRTEGHHEGKLGESSRKVEKIEDSKFTEELGRRIRDEEQGEANRMVENFTSSTQQRIEGMGACNAMEKERITGHEMVPDLSGTVQRKNDVVDRPLEGLSSSMHRRIEGTTTTMEKQRGTSNEKVPGLTSKVQRRKAMGQPVDNSTGSIQRTDGMCTVTAMSKERGTSNNMASNFIGTAQRRNDGMGRPVENLPSSIQRKIEGMGTSPAMEKERVEGNKVVPNLIGSEQRRHDGMGQPVENLTSSIQRKIEVMGASPAMEKKRFRGNEMAPNLIGTEQRGNDRMGQLVEKNADRKIEAKEKTKDRKAEDGKGDRHKDRDRNDQKSKTKNKDRQKEKEKEKEKMREKGEHKHKEHDKQRDSGKKDLVDSQNSKPLAPHKDNAKSVGADGHTNKRKDFEINGFLHENEARPNKLPRTTPSPHPPVENGRTLELCHIASPCSSIKHAAMSYTKAERVLDDKENKINGIPESVSYAVELRPPIALDASENGKVPSRPPHPDSKYLSLVYSVPKTEEWPESDDQEWLFSSENLRPKANFEADVTPQVWAEAMQIDSADVLALPYVIPF